MAVVYRGKDFRERHRVSLRALARGTGIRAATLVDLEKGRAGAHPTTLSRIIAYFQARGIPCDVGDLLVYEAAPEEADERRNASE